MSDKAESSNVARLTLRYQTRANFNQLSMQALGSGNREYPLDVFDKDIATHVVTGIQYGCDAYMIFEKTVSNSNERMKIAGELQTVIDLVVASVEGSTKLNLSTSERKATDNVNVKFYSDLMLDRLPTNFGEALDVYRALPGMIKAQKAVPKLVYLYPLIKLDSKASKLLRRISEELVDNAERLVDKMTTFKQQIAALIVSDVTKKFSGYAGQLENFQAQLRSAESRFAGELAVNVTQNTMYHPLLCALNNSRILY